MMKFALEYKVPSLELAACTGLLALFMAGCAAMPESDGNRTLTLNARTQQRGEGGVLTPVVSRVNWDPARTALVICDMWDDHWCRGAARRVAELAGPMNELVRAARAKGVFIIHAPSSTMEFYADAPQRRLAINAPYAEPPVPLSTAERWGTTWCWPDASKEPLMPIDDSDMGCDCEPKCELGEPWTRQIATIEIVEGDAITDHGQETYNLLAERGIENVILAGVHLNMCVLGRPFAIRQMVNVGKNVVLVRDMTDTMYNSKMEPYVDHFTGTDLVVKHIEASWCPSITSVDFLGGEPFRFKEDTR